MNVFVVQEAQDYHWTSSKGNQNKWFHEGKWYKEDDDKIISIERLFQTYYGKSAAREITQYGRIEDRISHVVGCVEQITGLQNFGSYIRKIVTVDALFLNEDRHFHNIAVIQKKDGTYRECPIFDNGAALFSDVRNDYPMDFTAEKCLTRIKAKPFSIDFDEQLDACECLYGEFNFRASFAIRDVEEILKEFAGIYDSEILERVLEVLRIQIRKYGYLFSE